MRLRAAAGAVVAAALAACATSPVRLGSSQLARRRDPAAAPAPGAPRVWLAPVEDRRADPDTLGQVAGRTISSTEVARWIEHELGGLASPSYALASGPGERDGARLAIHPRIMKAYLTGVNVAKTAVVVLEVDLVEPGGARELRLYRGQDTAMNWATGEGELTSALQDAAAACVGQLRTDLEARLAARSPPAAAVAAPR